MRARRPSIKVMVLTMHNDTHLAVEAFRAGASGYALKVGDGEELVARASGRLLLDSPS